MRIRQAASIHSQQLGLLKRQVERLTALVVQMLDVSRITGGGLELVPVPIDLRDVVRDVVERFELEIQRRNVSVTVNARTSSRRLGCRPRGSGRHQPAVECPQDAGAGSADPSAATASALLVVRTTASGFPRTNRTRSLVRSRARPRPGITRGSASACGSADRAGQRGPHQPRQPGRRRLDLHRGAAALSGPPPPLMIIDDDDDLRNALTFIMTAHGYQVGVRRAPGARRPRHRSPAVSHPAGSDDGWHVGLGIPRRPAREREARSHPVVVLTRRHADRRRSHAVGRRDRGEALRARRAADPGRTIRDR